MAADESVLLIPVLGLDPAISDLRLRYAPDARAGVPPHITVMYPFVEPPQLDEHDFATLSELALATSAFEYSLVALRQFDGGALYLEPAPAEPFIAMCQAISSRFGVVPYGGAYAEVVPHLTVAQSATDSDRVAITAQLTPSLPMTALALEVWLMVGHNERRWARRRSFSLGR